MLAVKIYCFLGREILLTNDFWRDKVVSYQNQVNFKVICLANVIEGCVKTLWVLIGPEGRGTMYLF